MQPAPDAAAWLADVLNVELPPWVAEVLHVVAGFADREHERGVLVPAHAERALAEVPPLILDAAAVRR